MKMFELGIRTRHQIKILFRVGKGDFFFFSPANCNLKVLPVRDPLAGVHLMSMVLTRGPSLLKILEPL